MVRGSVPAASGVGGIEGGIEGACSSCACVTIEEMTCVMFLFPLDPAPMNALSSLTAAPGLLPTAVAPEAGVCDMWWWGPWGGGGV